MSEEQKENKPWPVERPGYYYNCTKGVRSDPRAWDPDPAPSAPPAPSPAFHDESPAIQASNARLDALFDEAAEITAGFTGKGTPGFTDPDPSYMVPEMPIHPDDHRSPEHSDPMEPKREIPPGVMHGAHTLRMADTKATNPKDGIGIKKAPMSTLSMPVVYEMALAMLDGGCKYRRHNYRIAGVRVSIYYDAAMRHITRWWEGEELDLDVIEEDGTVTPGSGLPHLAHAMACLMIIRDGELTGNRTDDRPPMTMKPGWMDQLNRDARTIVEKYDGGKPPYVKGDEA